MSKANVSRVSICSEQDSQPTDQPVSDLDFEISEQCTHQLSEFSQPTGGPIQCVVSYRDQ